jgi:hypothetical protein
MSLKAFHLLFIAASLTMALGLGAWSLDAYLTRGEAGTLVLGIVGFGLAAGLIVYGRKIRMKFKHLGTS